MRPTLGRVVLYRSMTGNYTVPAMVTATVDSLWSEGVERGDVPGLTSEMHVHLAVFTPGDKSVYQEHDVPFDEQNFDGSQAGRPGDVAMPRTWAWPEGVV